VNDARMQLHQNAIVIDSHNDTTVSHIRRGNIGLGGDSRGNSLKDGTVAYLRGRYDKETTAEAVQINFPKMKQGGVDAAFFAVDVTRALKNHLTYALDAFGFLDVEVEENSEQVVIAKSASEIRRAKENGKLALLLVVENSDGVEGSLNVLRMLHRLGVRSIGLTHNISSWAADGNAETDSGGGLTSFGVRLVEEMNTLGILVDVSHISEPGFWDVMKVSQRPVIASHSNCRAVCDHPRNLSDGQIQALAENGGAMGVTFVPSFVSDTSPSIDDLFLHIDHAIQLVGPDHVGIGSDFDGGGTLVKDATVFPELTVQLCERGYSDEDVRKILGENHLRVIEGAIGD